MFMKLKLRFAVEVALIPVTDLLLIVPPVPAVPVPVTLRPPLVPVLLRTIPELALAVGALILRKVSPLAPIVVLTMFKAVPVVVVIVFGFAPVVTLTVPPVVAAGPGPVALNPAPLVVVIARPPFEKLMVAPALLANVTAAAVPVLSVFVAPLKLIVPPVLLATFIPVQVAVQLSVPEMLTVPAVRD